tara:strand:+ start:78 stop:371 length:294 start_codon:yes stop_codon:yes gene_type:complete
MPKVGKGNKAVHYPYSERGIKDAMAHANRTGESVEMEYGHGGMVKPMMPMKPMYGYGGKVKPKYAGGGMVLSPQQRLALVKMMYGGKVPKKSNKKKK